MESRTSSIGMETSRYSLRFQEIVEPQLKAGTSMLEAAKSAFSVLDNDPKIDMTGAMGNEAMRRVVNRWREHGQEEWADELQTLWENEEI
jgi:hypothetical protein